METEKYEEAIRDYEKVCKMDRSRGETGGRLKIKALLVGAHFPIVKCFVIKLSTFFSFFQNTDECLKRRNWN